MHSYLNILNCLNSVSLSLVHCMVQCLTLLLQSLPNQEPFLCIVSLLETEEQSYYPAQLISVWHLEQGQRSPVSDAACTSTPHSPVALRTLRQLEITEEWG